MPTTSDPARDAAISRLLRQVERFPDLQFAGSDRQDDEGALSARDRAFVRAIEHAAARHWLTVTALIRSRIDRPWERVQPQVRAALMAGAVQIFYFDRTPDHAATNHAVAWTAKTLNRRAAGFVNAIMRGLTRLKRATVAPTGADTHLHPGTDLAQHHLPLPDGRVIELTDDVFAAEPLERLAAQTSHPAELLARWLTAFGEETMRAIAMHNLGWPPIVLQDVPAAELPDSRIVPRPDRAGSGVWQGDHADLTDFLAAHPPARVQDATSASALELTRACTPARIADLCAGKGTKTAQLALLHPDAEIVASDPDRARLRVLRERFADDARISIIDSSQWISRAGAFDLVVLDVPCSNTGVLARRVEARYRFDRAHLESLVDVQRQILIEGVRLRAESGSILYTTCSIERAENEDQAAWMTKWHPLRIASEHTTLPAGGPGGDPIAYRDGGYACLLEPRPHAR